MRTALRVGLMLVSLAVTPAAAQPPTATDLVNQLQATLDLLRTSVFVPTTHVVKVAVGGNIQAAIDAAVDGTEIRIAPGSYAVNLILRANKNGIVIRSDVPDPILTLPWVTPTAIAWATLIPADTAVEVVRTEPASTHYTLRLLELTNSPTRTDRALVYAGDFNQTTIASVPSYIDVDRCYLHGSVNGGLRGISLNTRHSTVSGSYLSNFWYASADSQAIGVYTGPGPFLIQNNYLEGASENVMVGGVDGANAAMLPSDIVIRGNYFYKPLTWKGLPRNVKNNFELKGAQRVLIESNVFENSWTEGQQGHCIAFTNRDQTGTAPWTTIRDVVFKGNVIKNCEGSAFNLLGLDDSPGRPSVQGVNLTIDGNVVLNAWRGVMSTSGFQPTVITHNSFIGITNAALFLYGAPSLPGSWTLTDNRIAGGLYGVFGDAVGSGTPAFTRYAPSPILAGNVLEGSGAYPAGFTLVAPGTVTLATVGGADVAAIKQAIPWVVLP